MTVKAKMNRAGEIEFEFETQEDLKLFIAATANGSPPVPVSVAPSQETIDQRLGRLYGVLKEKDKQRNLITALLEGPPEGLKDAELRQKLGMNTNNELAGTVAGLSKNARSVGLSLEHVVTKRVLPEGVYRYRLTPDMRETVESIKEKPAIGQRSLTVGAPSKDD